MARCCGVQKDGDAGGAQCCPRSGVRGKRVDRQTVKAMLTPSALARLAPGEFWFCPDPACDVVYFSRPDACFVVTDLRVAVWQKEPFGGRQICYCFGESEDGIRREVESTGRSSSATRIREHIAAERCACDIRNPRGVCCLGDVISAVQRVSGALSPAGHVAAPSGDQSQVDGDR